MTGFYMRGSIGLKQVKEDTKLLEITTQINKSEKKVPSYLENWKFSV